jgi:uncharacterized damage-inducible protein DinB
MMKAEGRLAADNVVFLDQGVDLLSRLDDPLFRASPDGLFRGGVGAQFRHCIDFYGCFLDGLGTGRVDYSRRQRDERVETSRTHALAAASRVRERLLAIDAHDAPRALEVRSEEASSDSGLLDGCASTVGRELQFLVSHTIHHYALIAAVLRLLGHDVRRDFPEFGVAPSTLSHWRQAGISAP